MMELEARRALVRRLRRHGFDDSKSYRSGTVRPKCSQCQALVISGVACHEQRCPNANRRSKR